MGGKSARASIASLCLILFFLLPARAQVAGGSITGTVSGESGAVMPDVRVSVKDLSSGLSRNAVTNTGGLFSVPDLPPGSYEMNVSGAGFVTQVWTSITVTAGVERVLNVTMHPGDPTQVVRVAAPPALVSEPCPAVCGSANASTVRDTPLNGRDWAALTTQQAGVTGVQNGSATGGGNTDRGFGAAVSISGSRPDQNSYRLDGISINDYANGAPGSVLGDNLGIDAVEQVSVLGSNYPAEYGRTSGGVINVATKSGNNSFHGSLYEFLRNSSLDARNFFDGPVIPAFKRNQFGVSGGRALQKDRTFIFANYEGLRQSLGVTTKDFVPSPAARGGLLNFSDASQFPARCVPVPGSATPQCQVAVDPQISSFLGGLFFPLPNNPVPAGSNTGAYTFSAQQVTSENYFTVRFDHKFSGRDSVYVTYMRDNSHTISPDAFGELYSEVVSGRQVASLHEQHIFSPDFLNTATIGAGRAVGIQGQVTNVVNKNMLDHSYSFVDPNHVVGFAGAVQYIPGVTSFLGSPTAEGFVSSSRELYWTSYQGSDDAVLTRGRHTLKFGAEVERMQDNEVAASNINGSFRFDSLAQFLLNEPTSFSGTTTIFPPDIGIRETLFGAYIEDEIHPTKTLTLNAGLRYEMVTVPTESHGRTTSLRNLTDSSPSVGTPLFSNPTLRNFEPRLGFAWNPGSGKTLLRGGYGIFDVLPLPYEFTLSFQRANPNAQAIVGQAVSGDFPTGAFGRLSKNLDTGIAYYPESNPKRNYVMQWNLSVARELTNTLAVTVGYVGSRGIHQPYRVDNINMVLPTLTPAGYMWPCGPDGSGNPCVAGYNPNGTLSSTTNPNFGRINATLWQANSFYHAMQADVTKRVSHGIGLHAAYTFGKSIDTLSATEADDAFPNGLFNQLYTDQRTTRGLSDFNVAQDISLSVTWDIPAPNISSALAERVIGGWQVHALYSASTGQPFTPIMGGDPVGTKLDETGLVPSIVPGCNPINSNFKTGTTNLNYIKVNCFTLPNLPTSDLTSTSLPYGCALFTGSGALQPPAGRTFCANLRGNLGRNALIGPGISKLDFSIFKNNYIKRISESFNAQFRAEFFNIFNRANFSSPTDNLEIFDQTGVPETQSAGALTSTQTTSRQIQIALKLIW
jgi:Carboxypeptidase regulatory-like domain